VEEQLLGLECSSRRTLKTLVFTQRENGEAIVGSYVEGEPTTSGGLLGNFLRDVESGKLKAEPNQELCYRHLDSLFAKLPAYTHEINM
jgi:hypothetical protein